jgi:hypothetical protein
VLALVEMSPVEDLLLHLLRDKLTGVQVNSLIADDQTFPLVVVRNTGAWGDWGGDERFLDAGSVVVHTFAEGLNADSDAALLAEAVRVTLRDSVNAVVPGRGYISKQKMLSRPRRVTDWATATGPVQYADLPTGVTRYETTYEIEIRKPAAKPYA